MDGAFPSAIGDYGPDQDRRRGFKGTQENAKTKLCLRWKGGHCRFGDACNFAHGEDQIRQLPPRGSHTGGRVDNMSGSPSGQYSRSPPGRGSQQSRGGSGFSSSNGFGGRNSGPNGQPNDIWAQQGYPVPGPHGWTQYTTQDTKEQYYHNSRTQETVWDRPKEWTAP